jgi:hypothetical protein
MNSRATRTSRGGRRGSVARSNLTALACAALVAVAAGACAKKNEPKPMETNTTSAPIERDRPVETTGGTMTTGVESDPGNAQGGGAMTGTTEGTTGAGAGGTIGATGTSKLGAGRDAGVVGSDWPAVPIERQGSTLDDGMRPSTKAAPGSGERNATHGTGAPKNENERLKTDGRKR